MTHQETLDIAIDHISTMAFKHRKIADLCDDILKLCQLEDGQYREYDAMIEEHYEAIINVANSLTGITKQ